ncbi:MAG: zinc-dependent metalloprotease [Bdellovibrio sp.]|nr:zinc-dependent metalloprotease [Bdellovibrio sp.]
MFKGNNELKSVMLLALSALALASCTKEIPFKAADPGKKEHVIESSLVDQKAEYLYSASMQNASRSSADALPFSTGDNKRVKVEITEDTLRIVEVERDARYAPNTTNNKLLLEVPVEHVQFQCAKDKYGECTNSEEEAADVPWQQKSQIRVKLKDAKSGELDLLPIMISQTEGSDCYETVSTRLVSSNITADAINFQVERTFKTKLECLGNVDKLTDATVAAVFHYSLVKVNSVISKDYKTISYPEGSEDEGSFGFFSSRHTLLGIDNNKTDTSSIQIMNRWNPNRSEIVYYLSDEFAKPENKLIKDLTYETVGNINKGLEISGVKFRINLKDPAGKVPGDIRNSMIVLVEDPVESNIIGYGPQTEDPVTGEIISARTVMFLGTIKKFINSTYDEIVAEKKEALLAKKSVGITLSAGLANMVAFKKQSGMTAGISQLSAQVAAGKPGIQKPGTSPISPITNLTNRLAKAQTSLQSYTKNVNPEAKGLDLKSQLKYQLRAKNCAFEPNADSFGGGISDKLKSKFSDDAKPWNQLSDSEKNDVIAIILPEIWVPTLIHEMGHNLGLRHNFKASEDKDNFYSDQELLANGMDHSVPFSSVMDYGNDLKTLSVLGKYDIAALRFGYLREVEVQDLQVDAQTGAKTVTGTKTVSVTNTLDSLLVKMGESSQLKPYGFCTDEHLGINAGCKQFDLGTTLLEITNNMISDYEKYYLKRNFRNGRSNMSLMDDLAYKRRISSTFRDLRIMMESAERIKNIIGSDAKEWESVAWLKDLKQASLTAGTFLTKVILVPDLTCAVALKAKPNEVMALVRANELDKASMSCADVKLNDQYMVVGQTGKFLNSKKDPKSTNHFADQIDIRGIWADKVAAADTLLNRRIGIYTMDQEGLDNFLNVPELRDGISNALNAVMLNNVVDSLPFTLNDGSVVKLEVSYDLSDSQVVDRPLYYDAASGASKEMRDKIVAAFGLKWDGTTQLQEIIANKMISQALDTSGKHEQDKAFLTEYSVDRLNPRLNTELAKDSSTITLGDTKFVANANNNIAMQSITGYSIAAVVQAIPAEKLNEILAAKQKKQPMPETATAEEKAVWGLPDATLGAVASGIIKTTDFYARLLNILPSN